MSRESFCCADVVWTLYILVLALVLHKTVTWMMCYFFSSLDESFQFWKCCFLALYFPVILRRFFFIVLLSTLSRFVIFQCFIYRKVLLQGALCSAPVQHLHGEVQKENGKEGCSNKTKLTRKLSNELEVFLHQNWWFCHHSFTDLLSLSCSMISWHATNICKCLGLQLLIACADICYYFLR